MAFKKRTFLTEEISGTVKMEQVKLKLEEICPECKGQLLASQLKKTIE